MAQVSTIPQQLMTAALLHFQNGVPIDDCDCRAEHKRRLARVSHVYWQWVRNPFLDVFAMFKQLSKGKYADVQSAWRVAQKDKILFDFVKESVSPPSRRESEQKVRVTADRLMQMGAETDNGRDMAEGAKILMKLDRLDQPESEQAELSKTVFLPPIVTTVASDVDPTKKDVNDEQANAILRKYGAAIDEKRIMVEERVEVMMAARGVTQEETTIDSTEDTE
jgi:hypothetical protein